jgi:hypothetical protein
MDDWGFGFWVVPAALLAALCHVAAEGFKSDRSRAAKAAHRFLLVMSWIGFGSVGLLVVLHL